MKAMPINETIIAVPTTVEAPGQTRQFLVRLVEKLDIVLGYRGNDPYVSAADLQSATDANLTALEKTVLSIVTQVITENIDTISDEIVDSINALKSNSTVADADDSTQVISNPPTQVQVQNIQDQVVANATSLNDLLIALRETGIIAT
jgi:hypothetical protein